MRLLRSALRRVPRAALAMAALCASPASAGEWKFKPFHLKNKKADFEARLTGYLQLDFRAYDWKVGDPGLRRDTADIRRARTGFEVAWKKLSLDFDLEWTGRAQQLVHDNAPPYDPAEVKNAYVAYEFSKKLSLRVGTFKLPVGYEHLTSKAKTDFVERSLLANALAPDRNWGVMGIGGLGKKVDYQLGVFAGDDRTNDASSKATVAGRVVFKPWKPLDVGACVSAGGVKAAPDAPGFQPDPRGFHGESPSGWRFYARKFVDGRRLRLGLDSQYTRGGLQLKGELLQAREERKRQGPSFQDVPSEVGTGWSATASYILTGEKKQRTLKPKKPLTKHGIGLIELAAKYDTLRFDDSGPSSGFEGAGNRARNLRPAQDRILWGGVSWLPTEWVRVYGDVYAERYGDALLAPEPPGARFVSGTPRQRGSYITFVARVQLILP